MSYYDDKYEFMGQDSAGFRGGEVEFQVSEFCEPMGMSRRILPWARIIQPVILIYSFCYHFLLSQGRKKDH
eukprot:COSAG02_NODE_37_length_48203_cov_57.745708_12_plen_71_part_00